MKIKVTRAQVIRALQTEPLKSGSFVFHEEQNPEFFKNKTGCAVCAVGSILDCSIGTKTNAEKVAGIASRLTSFPTFGDCFLDDDNGNSIDVEYNNTNRQVVAAARKIARQGKYLSALSSLFEELSDRPGMTTNNGLAGYRLVNILVNFVKSEFPSRLVIDTNRSY